jgi:hydrogenase maturation protein HypF
LVLERTAGAAALADDIAPGMTTYGFFLPYTPLHHLLLADAGRPLVMTSGNLSDEPIAYQDDEAAARLAPLADALLAHDRPIHVRTDDSVVRVFRSQPYLMRRSRGYAPLPVGFSGSSREILAVGAHLKNTFCLTRGSRAFVSHHIGDLENLETLRSLREGVDHFSRLFSLSPEAVAHDLHPDYLSSRFAREYAREHDLPLVAVQHHEAHAASVMADARHEGPVIGVAFDGAGLGSDGTIWGGEFFAGSPGDFRRVGHLELVPLPGGDAAVREPWRVAAALLDHLYREGEIHPDASVEADERIAETVLALPGGCEFSMYPWRLVLQAARRGIGTPLTSSVGRLFDGVSALLGLRHRAAYEGQAAILLEAAARRSFGVTGLPDPAAPAPWPGDARYAPDLPALLPVNPFVRGVLDQLRAGTAPDEIAARFHHSLAAATAELVVALARQHAVDTVALGGGVFQNLLLLELLVERLETAGLRPLVHRAVPTNDGGLCLGQAEIAAALLHRAPVRT